MSSAAADPVDLCLDDLLWLTEAGELSLVILPFWSMVALTPHREMRTDLSAGQARAGSGNPPYKAGNKSIGCLGFHHSADVGALGWHLESVACR